MRAILLLLSFLLAGPAAHAASSFLPDASDMWYHPEESGWGVTVIQQQDTLFMMVFAFGQDGSPRWYVASAMRPAESNSVVTRFEGTLYEVTGPRVGDFPFNPGLVNRRAAGTAAFSYFPPDQASISYTVDGAGASRALKRFAFARPDISGEFVMTRVLQPYCGNGTPVPGAVASDTSIMTVGVSGDNVQITSRAVTAGTPTCNYSGTMYRQLGRFSTVGGSFSCTDGRSGTFDLSEVEVSRYGFMAKFFASDNQCSLHGNFAGTRTSLRFTP